MSKLTTLDSIVINPNEWTDSEKLRRNMLLLLASHLSTLQSNIAKEIELLYKDKGEYRMTIKHNHEKIKKLIKENTSNVFFSRLNDGQGLSYSDDAEMLERLVYTWAGLEHPSNKSGLLTALNLNLSAREAWECAVSRGKIKGTRRPATLLQLEKIKEEVRELCEASNNRSIHIPYTEQQEEAADVIIATLTLLHGQGIDINELIEDKMNYNARRKD